ncbi:unnamed protein product [Rotaria sordida]|uniref:Uncharacterized protein n=1 Tax=Rotaria sordida TaxID=392033 RepID=A0A814JGT5_9BILA|nr:unnamed protein product [Rotaria sordida]CAF0906237.1 unnamed protein product [Rotaria sordida]CAF0973432.1 unnamed protein product [Rotaria sordida]CAF1035052.1 unnamed protein product [Rotaria sordida]CAF1037842.1 unnamed protein product [Rotaria sordida]
MTKLESQVFFKWLPIVIIPLLIIIILGLSYWIFSRRRRRNDQNSNNKKLEKEFIITESIHQTMVPKNEYLSSPIQILTKKSWSKNSTEFTNADITHLDKLFRTASDRLMWKQDYLTKDQHNKLRKVPSGQTQQKTLFSN